MHFGKRVVGAMVLCTRGWDLSTDRKGRGRLNLGFSLIATMRSAEIRSVGVHR
jgi:hypothetical protein